MAVRCGCSGIDVIPGTQKDSKGRKDRGFSLTRKQRILGSAKLLKCVLN